MEKEVNELLKEKFLCQNKFTSDIESLVQNSDLNYIEAIITYCEENNIELESVNKLISKPLKEKLKAEALDLNYLKKTTRSRLPI
jgi:UDP-glucose 6-dehydrogenase